MSELFMECVEEELEPWQKQVPQVHLIDDDDDEPIFVGVLCMCLFLLTFKHMFWFIGDLFMCKDWVIDASLFHFTANNQKDDKPNPAPRQKNSAVTQKIKSPSPQSTAGPSPIVLPLNVPASTAKTASPTLTSMTPQPVIVNNQVFFM